MYRCLHGQAPRYLADHLITASDVASRLRLRFANRHQLMVPRCRLNTYGRRALVGRRGGVKGAITSKIKHAIKLKTSPARLAQLLQPSLAFCFSLQPMTAHRPVRRHWLQAKTKCQWGLQQLCKSCRTCFKFYCMLYCMFYFTCHRILSICISDSASCRIWWLCEIDDWRAIRPRAIRSVSASLREPCRWWLLLLRQGSS